jgi:DNA-binding NtrC family response regulator
MSPQTILIVESNPDLRINWKRAFINCYRIEEIDSERAAVEVLRQNMLALVIVGSCDAGCKACLRTVANVRQLSRGVPIILVAKEGNEDLAVAAFRAGATDYIRYPFTDAKLEEILQRNGFTARVNSSAMHNEEPSDPESKEQRMIGNSPAMLHLQSYIGRVAGTDCNVLITGETGTGKELVAELIHRQSKRKDGPFLCVNCAAIPDTLLESELFGYERGAFTGALRRQEGKLRLTNGGTILFDEIGDMSLQGQAKILRAIETRQVLRLGSAEKLALDIRILAATNRDTGSLSSDASFRKDLLFRLNVTHIHLPPLRDRKVDIPDLLDFYRKRFNALFRSDVHGFNQEILQLFLHYSWPGNIRELKNTIEALFLNSPSAWVGVDDLSDEVRSRLSFRDSAAYTESDRVLSALLSTNWNKSKAAEKLCWSRMTLYRKLAKYHLTNKAN